MCILLYEKLLWCSSIPYIYAQLEGVNLHLVYVHSAICETYFVQWYSIDLWSIGGGGLGIYAFCYIIIFFGVACIPYIYAQLEGSTSALHICAFCYMLNVFSVVVFHTSMVNWWGVNLHSVYVHSAICETYFVQWYSIDLWSIGGGGPLFISFCYM